MKKILLSSGFFIVFCLLLSSYQQQPVVFYFHANDEIQNNYREGLLNFAIATQQLEKAALSLQLQDSTTWHRLQSTFKESRYAFKDIEFLAAYLDGEFVDDYLNGPPLLSLERNSPNLSILEPEGMQVLEELVFAENPADNKEALVQLASHLAQRSEEFRKFQSNLYLTDRHIFEAARFEMIRVFSLGVTGFDSPVTLNSLQEARHSLFAVQAAIQTYYPLLHQKSNGLEQQLEATFQSGFTLLEQQQDFDTFDRLSFLTKTINPLYKKLLEAQLSLQIETYYEVPPIGQKHAVNYLAKDIFSEDLLNPYYYTRMQEDRASDELISLGRTLFFDPILSNNTKRSCASCHQPEKGFTDGITKSVASDFNGTVQRNAPTLLNAVYSDRYFYDLRTDVLEDQMDHVITDHKEFGTSYLEIFRRLNKSREYVELFENAFPEVTDAPINKYTFSTAIASYLLSLKSFNSPFDQYVRGEIAEIDESVKHGFNIFMGKAACGSCHFAPTFSGNVPPVFQESESEVLGVPASTDTLNPVMDADLGRYYGVMKEQAPFYKHSFKTTTVRNVVLTAPYMHNGVYKTLDEVVDFYNKGGGIGLGMDIPNQTLAPDPLNLSEKEKQDLIAFLQSLTDTTQLQNVPRKLPDFAQNPEWNNRKIGGEY